MKTVACIAALLCFVSTAAFALGARGTPVRPVGIYISPDATSPKLAVAKRGHELIILETSRDWLHVEALLSEPRRDSEFEGDDEATGRTVSGWVKGRDVIQASTPNGDRILYGEAVDSEDQASRSHGRPGAAQDAQRLYSRVADLFPDSPLAGEALYRSADIRWQLDKEGVMSRPSAKQQDAFLRGEINERWMKQVMKKFPGTRWADLAAFHLIDNKLCGSWQGASKCPAKEADLYEKYAREHPQPPAVTQALYDAAWRWAALIEIYKTEGDQKKSDDSRTKAIAVAQQAVSQPSKSEWGDRAQTLLYLLQQGIPTYGNAED
jgi:cation transport regulator ChaB